MTGARKLGIAGFLLSAGLACTQLLGTDRENTLAPGPAPAARGTLNPAPPFAAAPEGLCSAGQFQCNGALLQTCADDQNSWITVQSCAAAALCQPSPALCLPATCGPDEMTCAGAVLQRCNADRTGWDVFNTCLSPAHCNADLRQCLIEPCNPGDRRCDRSQTDQSPVLESCNGDRSGWTQLDACVTRELCDQTLTSVGQGGLALGSDGMVQLQPATDPSTVVRCNLPTCATGETRCEGASLQFCSEGRTGWITAEECASVALCQRSLGTLSSGGTPQCVPAACAAGEHRCADGGLLQACSDDRSSFVDEQQCIGAPFCNAALANQGQSGCTDAPCEAGLMQCNGAQLEVCRDDRTGLDPVGGPCESAALCNAEDPANAFCEEPLCRRGATSGNEFRCEGAQLQRCNESLTVYDTLQTCVTPALCDASQRLTGCRPPVCQPGQFNCGSGFLQVCNAGQTGFDNVENCGSQAQCDANAGRCADPCEPGSTRCNASNGDLERCNDRLTGWQPIADCPNVQLCDAQNQRCRICVPNEFSCADGQLRQCDAEGRTFARTNVPAECALTPNGGGGIRSCQGNTVVVNPCPLGCQQPENRCSECTPGQTQCVGNGQLRTCGNNGFYGAPTNCSDGNFCNGTETCANNQCVSGAAPGCNGFGCQLNRCNNCNGGQCANGTQFQTCDNGLISTARNCPAGQVCQGGGNCVFNCAALNCNDGNACTNDTCTAQAGCTRTNVANGTNCGDGNACNGAETCQNGNCNRTGAAVTCNDNNACTVDSNNNCNPQTGTCTFPAAANSAVCQNGQLQRCVNGQRQVDNCGGNGCSTTTNTCNTCANNATQCSGTTAFQTCVNGVFQAPTACPASSDPCRPNTCSAQTGACGGTNAPNGTACNGGAGTCQAGNCLNCIPNSTICVDGVPQRCNATGTGRPVVNACVGNVATRCVGTTFTTQTCGGTTPACNAGTCTCAPGTRTCNGSQVLECSATGQLVPIQLCNANGVLVCNGGAPFFQACPGASGGNPCVSAGCNGAACTAFPNVGAACRINNLDGSCDVNGQCCTAGDGTEFDVGFCSVLCATDADCPGVRCVGGVCGNQSR